MTFIQRWYTNGHKHVKILSTFSNQRNADQNTMRKHLTPIRMDTVKKIQGVTVLAKTGSDGNPCAVLKVVK